MDADDFGHAWLPGNAPPLPFGAQACKYASVTIPHRNQHGGGALVAWNHKGKDHGDGPQDRRQHAPNRSGRYGRYATASTDTRRQAAKGGFQSLKDEAQNLAGTAKTAALNAAATGKDRAADALSEAATFIETAAQTPG